MNRPSEQEQRAAVVAEAKSWLRTPYHHHACIKGAGVDCAYFVIEVYSTAGVIERFDPGYYPRDWFLHRGEEKYLEHVFPHAREIETPQPGDLAVYKIGRLFAHGAVVIEWPLIIHADSNARCVTYAEGDSGNRPRRFFTLWGQG